MKKIQLRLKDRSYPIFIGAGAFDQALRALPAPSGSKAFILADSRVRSGSRKIAQALTRHGWISEILSVRAGEDLKDFSRILPLYGKLVRKGADRNSIIVALGGGVIGDVAGFIAATYMRGIAWVGVPSTLLAQVDSGIGGKTGVNHPRGKNLIGAFHQPAAVACDPALLRSLSKRDLVSGLGEVIKYGLILDAEFFNQLERNHSRILALDPEFLERAIARCVRLKAGIVESDERERKGLRDVLNFGHTLGHAIERATHYKRFRHGEAVLIGMRFACELSVLRGHLNPKINQRIRAFLDRLPTPSLPKNMKPEQILSAARSDKKARSGRLSFVLLRGIGKTVLDEKVTDAEVLTAIRKVLS